MDDVGGPCSFAELDVTSVSHKILMTTRDIDRRNLIIQY